MALVTPSNIALKQFTHFIQCLRLKIFSQYDYGEKINLKAYGTSDPPPYELERVDAPMALYIGKNDQIADLKVKVIDVINQLNMLIFFYVVGFLSSN